MLDLDAEGFGLGWTLGGVRDAHPFAWMGDGRQMFDWYEDIRGGCVTRWISGGNMYTQ